jgi:cellulose biosynthesis protein BcsQ/outer membrane protein OmpA-like peptidoglycan-associated protein
MPAPSANVEGNLDQSVHRDGRVVCFVSAKGGSGKTLLSATTAFILAKAGKRVLTIDTDFSTRGITLYFMGPDAQRRTLSVAPENCLSDALEKAIPIDQILPRIIVSSDVKFELLLSSTQAWNKNLPDDRMLGSGGERQTSSEEYFHFLKRVLDRFRLEYDYIIIDTRGGYDFTSAAPALLADGYVVVLEADQISVLQVFGLKARIEELGERYEIRPALSGFIVNKAAFSLEDRSFSDTLIQLYGGAHFGTIPLDIEAVRAYQVRRIPLDMRPDSDFAQHAFQTVERLVSPSLNWADVYTGPFYAIGTQIETLWRARRSWQAAQKMLPAVILILALAPAASYLLVRNTTLGFSNTLFYFCSALFVFASTSISAFVLLRNLQSWRLSRSLRLALSAYGIFGAGALFWLTFNDVRTTFSQSALSARIYEQNTIISKQQAQIGTLSEAAQNAERRALFAAADQNLVAQQLKSVQQQLTQEKSTSAALSDRLRAVLIQVEGRLNGLAATTISFGINSSSFEGSLNTIVHVATILSKNSGARAQIVGRAYARETVAAALAARRAEGIRDALVKYGVNPAQLSMKSEVTQDNVDNSGQTVTVTIQQ